MILFRQCLKTLELIQTFTRALCLGLAYVQKSLFDRAIEGVPQGNRLVGRDPGALAVLGFAYGVSGRTSDARELWMS